MNKFICFFILTISLLSFQLTSASAETDPLEQENLANCQLTFRVQNHVLDLHSVDIVSVNYNRRESYISNDIYNDDSKINGVRIKLSRKAGEDFNFLIKNSLHQNMQMLWCNQLISEATIQSALGSTLSLTGFTPESAKAFYRWADTLHDIG